MAPQINIIFQGDVLGADDMEERIIDMVETGVRRGRIIG